MAPKCPHANFRPITDIEKRTRSAQAGARPFREKHSNLFSYVSLVDCLTPIQISVLVRNRSSVALVESSTHYVVVLMRPWCLVCSNWPLFSTVLNCVACLLLTINLGPPIANESLRLDTQRYMVPSLIVSLKVTYFFDTLLVLFVCSLHLFSSYLDGLRKLIRTMSQPIAGFIGKSALRYSSLCSVARLRVGLYIVFIFVTSSAQQVVYCLAAPQNQSWWLCLSRRPYSNQVPIPFLILPLQFSPDQLFSDPYLCQKFVVYNL